jgi:hypothetical protein
MLLFHYPQEFLNFLSSSGFPPHKLKLKIDALITLLRNLQPPNLCNCTRLQTKSLQNNIIEAVILKDATKGEISFILRISMLPSDWSFSFKRLQFPVKVSFAITINKAQDQILYIRWRRSLKSVIFIWTIIGGIFSKWRPESSYDFNFNRR